MLRSVDDLLVVLRKDKAFDQILSNSEREIRVEDFSDSPDGKRTRAQRAVSAALQDLSGAKIRRRLRDVHGVNPYDTKQMGAFRQALAIWLEERARDEHV